jgi:hypothetical protein
MQVASMIAAAHDDAVTRTPSRGWADAEDLEFDQGDNESESESGGVEEDGPQARWQDENSK